MIKERNNVVDALRGVAMLLVVLGHVMTGIVIDANNTFLYNIIWSLQMPLFMIISGYICRYSKPIMTAKDLLIYIRKRSVAYLMPLVVWTVIRDFEASFLDLFFQIDITYWFLFSLWTISMIIGVSQYIANKVVKEDKPIVKEIVVTVIYAVMSAMLLLVGVLVSLSFLGIGLTLYYVPFFLMGYLYGKLKPYIENIKNQKLIIEIFVAICAVIYVYILMNYNLPNSSSIFEQAVRFVGSTLGCITVCSLLSRVFEKSNKLTKAMSFVGKQSLEIYLIHYFVIFFTTRFNNVKFDTVEGVTAVFVCFVIAVSVSLILINIFNKNKALNFILFGKIK